MNSHCTISYALLLGILCLATAALLAPYTSAQDATSPLATLNQALAPPFDPEAVDERGRKLRKPVYNLAHLRARARVHMALEQWDIALADAEEIYSRQYAADSGMSQRTPELDEAEAFRDEILRLGKPKAE